MARLREAPALVSEEAEHVDAWDAEGLAYRGYLGLARCSALLLGDDSEASDTGGGDDERVCAVAILGGLHQQRMLSEHFACSALDALIKCYEHVGGAVDQFPKL